MNDFLEKLVKLLADEVVKQLPKPQELSDEEFRSNIGLMLVEAEWFKEMVKGHIQQHMLRGINDLIAEQVEGWFGNNSIESEISDVLNGYDFSHDIEVALKNFDFEQVIEDNFSTDDFVKEDDMNDAIDNKIDERLDEYPSPKKLKQAVASAEAFERFMDGIRAMCVPDTKEKEE